MLEILISYLNSRITSTGYINSVMCLAEIIDKGEQSYPAIYVKNDYVRIDLDKKGSLSYWRKNGDVSYSENENSSKVGQIEYVTSVPLKLVCFIKKDNTLNSPYFADNIVEAMKSLLSTNTAILNKALKAKKTLIVATKYNTNGKVVASDEYSGIKYEPRYTHVYFSIDFEIKIVSNQNCYNDICDTDFTVPESGELVSFCSRVVTCQKIYKKLPLPTGDIDGINRDFTFTMPPESVMVNGQDKLDYIINGNTVTLTDAPFAFESVWGYANY